MFFFQENRKVFKTGVMTLQQKVVNVNLFEFYTRFPVKIVILRCSEALAIKCLSEPYSKLSCRNELDKVCFQHIIPYEDVKNLSRKNGSDK